MSVHIPVFLAADDNYAPFVTTTVASMCYNSKSSIDFYILNCGISSFHKCLISELERKFTNCGNIEYLNVDVDNVFASLCTSNAAAYLTNTMFARFLIPDLKPELDRALYCDVDVIALGDIADMYEQNLDIHATGAVYHPYYDASKMAILHRQLRFGLSPKHRYFNSGALLIDCKKWRLQKASEKLLSIAGKFKINDQDTLNIFFDNNYQELDNKFNFTSKACVLFSKTDKKEYQRLQQEAVIRHFEEGSKPWLTDEFYEGCPLDNFNDFWFFAAMTPFYHGLQQKFIASRIRKEVFSKERYLGEIIGNIKKPDQNMLNNLRSRIKGGDVP